MPLFMPKKEFTVQNFILKLLNNNCPDLEAMVDGPRLEGRINLVMVVLVVPVENDVPLADEAFAAVTKEFSSTGLAVVLDRPRGLDEVMIGFRWEAKMTFVRATAKHLNPMGGGFYQLGFQLTEAAHPGDFPQLQSMGI